MNRLNFEVRSKKKPAGIQVGLGGTIWSNQDAVCAVKCVNTGRKCILGLGANITFDGGFALQTLETWARFIDTPPREITFGGRDAELYFETEALDGFLTRLRAYGGAEYVTDVVASRPRPRLYFLFHFPGEQKKKKAAETASPNRGGGRA